MIYFGDANDHKTVSRRSAMLDK